MGIRNPPRAVPRRRYAPHPNPCVGAGFYPAAGYAPPFPLCFRRVGVLDAPPHTLLAICRAAPMCAAAGHAPPFPLCFRRGRRPRRPAGGTFWQKNEVFRQLHSYLFAAMWMLRCDKRGLSPEKISNTVTFRRSSAAAQGDAGPSAGGSSLFWRAFFRAHRPCDHGSQKGESKLLWQKN